MIGKRLAHYEITGSIGKGGMGEVCRARDTKLGRDVAIKVLPARHPRVLRENLAGWWAQQNSNLRPAVHESAAPTD